MAAESSFVGEVLDALQGRLSSPLFVKRSAVLLYGLGLDQSLELPVDPTNPIRGDSAFQTDLCVFEKKHVKKEASAPKDILFPRVVIEFKTKVTTHDVITYSAKALRHKQVYPWLRYGFITEDQSIPRRFFVHNEGIDFYIAANGHGESKIDVIWDVIEAEVQTSRSLEDLAFRNARPITFRAELCLTPSN